MKNQLKILLLSLLFGLALPLVASAKPSYVVDGYLTYDALSSYPVTTAFSNPVNNGTNSGGIPWADLSHVSFGFVTISGTAAVMDDPAGMVPAMIAQAHANGVRVYLSVGGATPAAQWSGITSNAAASALASSVTALMVQHQGAPVTFDGVDVDCEFPGVTNFPSAAVFTTFVQDLRADLNGLSPGLAPSGSYAGESNVGLTMYLSPGAETCGYQFGSLNSSVDWYMLSGYDMNDGVAGDAWNAALVDTTTIKNCANNTVTQDVKAMAAWYNTNDGNIPYSKMVLGMPFFGSNNGGTAFIADNNIFTAGTAGAYNSGTAECIYNGTYSMDTAQSFCDKMNWAMSPAIGMKGIGIWDLTDGLPVTANAMMTNIWNTIAGTSCVTISTPCAACTSTPTPVPLPSCGVLVDNFEDGSYFSALGFSDSLSYGGGCGSTANPTNANGWYPSIGYGLNGSQLGGRTYGTIATTSTSCWGPTLLIGLGGYNAGSVNAFSFNIRVDGGNKSGGGTTFVVGTLNTATQYQYNYLLSIPAANVGSETSAAASVVSSQWGTTMAVTVLFSQMTPNGSAPAFSSASLYDLYFEPYNPTASGTWTGNYDYTVDNIYFLCAPTPTPTATNTNTFTPTKTFTPTTAITNTFTNTPTFTYSYTNTPTKTYTPANTNTFTNTITNTPTKTYTPANTNTFTNTITNTSTKTLTPTNSFTNTPANTSTFTNSFTPTNSFTNTPTKTLTPTNSFTNTPANTNTFTTTFSNTPTKTLTPTNSFTNTRTSTNTPTNTLSPTNTGTPTNTNTGTQPPTNTFTSSFTPTKTFTNTDTPTNTATLTNSFTNTPANTSTSTWTSTFTSTKTPTPTNSFTGTPTPTSPFTATFTYTPTNTGTSINTSTLTWTGTSTFTPTDTNTPTFTNSPTVTFTFTNSNTGTLSPTDTPTNTSTSTSTGTSTNTSTSTFTSVFTNTSTVTNTASFTQTPSPSFTPTATFTATQPVVEVGNGNHSPSNQTIPAGSSNQVVLQLSVDDTSGENLQLNSLTLTLTLNGTATASTGISSITVWKDPSGNGTTAGSSVLATVVNPFASGSSAVVNFNDIVGAGTTQDYLITYTFTNGVTPGDYSVSVSNGSALAGQGVSSGKSLQVQGAPVNGAILTVVAMTATPSFTPTVSFTATPTFSVTPTLSPTPLPIVTLGDPYPNPVSGSGEVSIDVTAPADSSLSWAVFTTAFRKVWDDTIPVPAGPSTIHWNLRDKNGVPVSDGLYYIRIQVTGLHSTTHIFKVLVLQ